MVGWLLAACSLMGADSCWVDECTLCVCVNLMIPR